MSIDILYVSSAERGGTAVWVMLLSVAAEAGKVRTLVVLMRPMSVLLERAMSAPLAETEIWVMEVTGLAFISCCAWPRVRGIKAVDPDTGSGDTSVDVGWG